MSLSSLVQKSAFYLRKAQHRLTRTEDEKVLDYLLDYCTTAAIAAIATALEIPAVTYKRKTPLVLCDPSFLEQFSTEASYTPFENIIRYASIDVGDQTIFEESGHFLQYCLLGEVFAPIASGDPLTQFFFSANREAVGYFCSQLSTVEREDTFVDFCQNLASAEAFAELEEEPDPLEKGKLPLSRQADFLNCITKESGELLYEVVRSSFQEQRPFFERLEDPPWRELYNLFVARIKKELEKEHSNPDVFELAQRPELFFRLSPSTRVFLSLPEDLFQDLFAFITVLQIDQGLFQELDHLIGYDLGAALFRLYQDDQPTGKQLVKQLMHSPSREALPAFFQMHRELHDAGYSPLERLADISYKKKDDA